MIFEKQNNKNLFIYKYQPQLLKDFENSCDANLLQTIKTLIDMNYINILFTGNVASGKTSLLNAIVREYYMGYEQREYDENVLYINSLKEQGINYCRTDVKIFCQTCSSIKNKKKIIILDDIDLINEQSQQVFRNCIDKYSHNVHFLSSCTNVQKVIESLQSRFINIKLETIKREHLLIVLNKIKETENIEIEPDAEEFIINVSNNTIKVLINYMEKFKLYGEKITYELAVKLCTNISFLLLDEYTEHIISGRLKEAIKLIYEIHDKGYSVMDILDNYFTFIKATSLLDEITKYNIISIIIKYITIFHNIHEDEIELALFTNNIVNCISR